MTQTPHFRGFIRLYGQLNVIFQPSVTHEDIIEQEWCHHFCIANTRSPHAREGLCQRGLLRTRWSAAGFASPGAATEPPALLPPIAPTASLILCTRSEMDGR